MLIKRFASLSVLVLVLLVTQSSTCNKSPFPGAEPAMFVDLSGLDACGMMIELDNGTRLEPINLTDFSNVVDGKRIWVDYVTVSATTACMAGETVEIINLSDR